MRVSKRGPLCQGRPAVAAVVVVQTPQRAGVGQLPKVRVLSLDESLGKESKSFKYSSLNQAWRFIFPTWEWAFATDKHCTHSCAFEPSFACECKTRVLRLAILEGKICYSTLRMNVLSWVKISKAFGIFLLPSLVTLTERIDPTSKDCVTPMAPSPWKRFFQHLNFLIPKIIKDAPIIKLQHVANKLNLALLKLFKRKKVLCLATL